MEVARTPRGSTGVEMVGVGVGVGLLWERTEEGNYGNWNNDDEGSANRAGLAQEREQRRDDMAVQQTVEFQGPGQGRAGQGRTGPTDNHRHLYTTTV